jgi:hypothetical protein
VVLGERTTPNQRGSFLRRSTTPRDEQAPPPPATTRHSPAAPYGGGGGGRRGGEAGDSGGYLGFPPVATRGREEETVTLMFRGHWLFHLPISIRNIHIYLCSVHLYVYLSTVYITSRIRRHQETPQKKCKTFMVILLVLFYQISLKPDSFGSSVLLINLLIFCVFSALAFEIYMHDAPAHSFTLALAR